MARSAARKSAMMLLYEREMGGDGVDLVSGDMIDEELSKDDFAYIQAVMDGCQEKADEIDGLIEKNAVGWSFDRIARVDLSTLRLAVYEMLYREDIPVSVSINEAVDLCHEFSTPEAASFVNGILGTIARQMEKA